LLAARALPQPDQLGHLLSWTRDAPGWRGRLRRTPVLDGGRSTSPPRRTAYAVSP
jgi:hypothetical protein